MSILQEYKTFAMRGNVVDMAVGVVIGTAFGKIVSSLVADVIMPPIGLLIGGIDFSDIVVTLKDATPDAAAVTMNIGIFIQTILDFLIIAFAVFIALKGINRLKKKEEAAPAAPAEPPAPPKQEVLLEEIRDLLKQNSQRL